MLAAKTLSTQEQKPNFQIRCKAETDLEIKVTSMLLKRFIFVYPLYWPTNALNKVQYNTNYKSELMVSVTPTVPAPQRHLQMAYEHAASQVTAAVQTSVVLTAIFEMLQR